MQKIHGPWYYEMRHLGNNYRMSDINAALGISQLRKINKFIKKRKYISNFYNKIFLKIINLSYQTQIRIISIHIIFIHY